MPTPNDYTPADLSKPAGTGMGPEIASPSGDTFADVRLKDDIPQNNLQSSVRQADKDQF